MRIITGIARGRRLETLRGDDTRPTGEKVKEGVFSAIQFDIEGRRVLDLFAGSGQLGLETLSRGAKSAVFVDSSKAAAEIVTRNITATGLEDFSTVRVADCVAFLLSAHEVFDLIFLDPPYSKGFFEKVAPHLDLCSSEACTVIYEHPSEENKPDTFGKFTLKRSYSYGKTAVSIYKNY